MTTGINCNDGGATSEQGGIKASTAMVGQSGEELVYSTKELQLLAELRAERETASLCALWLCVSSSVSSVKSVAAVFGQAVWLRLCCSRFSVSSVAGESAVSESC